MPDCQLSQYCNHTTIPTWQAVQSLDYRYRSTLSVCYTPLHICATNNTMCIFTSNLTVEWWKVAICYYLLPLSMLHSYCLLLSRWLPLGNHLDSNKQGNEPKVKIKLLLVIPCRLQSYHSLNFLIGNV